ncbi:MAG: 1-phosphofructokinase, partial [Clostridia bacterium]|nr:1-phosphofructokinase [Clostridia bacterium]
MQIFTLTLNPAFDIHYELDTLTLGAEQYARRVMREAGGKGINTSRALTVNGVENTAFAVLGADNAA